MNTSNQSLGLAEPRLAAMPDDLSDLPVQVGPPRGAYGKQDRAGRWWPLSDHERTCILTYDSERRPLGINRAQTALDLRRRFGFARLDEPSAARIADVLHSAHESRLELERLGASSMAMLSDRSHVPPIPPVVEPITGIEEIDVAYANDEDVVDTAERLAVEKQIPFVEASEQAVRIHELARAIASQQPADPEDPPR